jgi:hypothetical protein
MASVTRPSRNLIKSAGKSITIADCSQIVGNFSNGGAVLFSGGTGMKSFDVTNDFIAHFNANDTSVGYRLDHTGYSGFTFGSADGGDPAFLRITTTGNDSVPIPEPTSLLLVGAGLIALAGAKRKNLRW